MTRFTGTRIRRADISTAVGSQLRVTGLELRKKLRLCLPCLFDDGQTMPVVWRYRLLPALTEVSAFLLTLTLHPFKGIYMTGAWAQEPDVWIFKCV
jgi:hypothetical protein